MLWREDRQSGRKEWREQGEGGETEEEERGETRPWREPKGESRRGRGLARRGGGWPGQPGECGARVGEGGVELESESLRSRIGRWQWLWSGREWMKPGATMLPCGHSFVVTWWVEGEGGGWGG